MMDFGERLLIGVFLLACFVVFLLVILDVYQYVYFDINGQYNCNWTGIFHCGIKE